MVFPVERAMLAQTKFIAQISFAEWTNHVVLYHATFEGLRDDKEPRAVVREPAAA
jgi:bifunctional non-homologous end joining protein LigD